MPLTVTAFPGQGGTLDEAGYGAALSQRGSLYVWVSGRDCALAGGATSTPGGQPSYSSFTEFRLVQSALTGIAGRGTYD